MVNGDLKLSRMYTGHVWDLALYSLPSGLFSLFPGSSDLFQEDFREPFDSDFLRFKAASNPPGMWSIGGERCLEQWINFRNVGGLYKILIPVAHFQ